jgi:hypothetical protein
VRFTETQVALFRCGISFVHMASDRDRMETALKDFQTEVNKSGLYYTVTFGFMKSGSGATAAFRYCTPTPASVDHVPVIFMDGKKSEFSIPRLYEDAKHIPQEFDGHGPMVVR